MNITGNRKADGDGVYYPSSAAALLKLLYTVDYQLLHLHVGGRISNRVLGLMLACTTVPGKRTVFTLHSGGFPSSPEGRSATDRGALARVLRRFDAVIGVNPQLIELFLRLGVRSDRAHLIYPFAFGPRTEQIAALPASALPEPLRGFFATHRPLLLSVGLLEAEYDVPLQIAALGEVRRKHPNAGLAILGSGSREAELRTQIAAVPWATNVLLPGDIDRDATLLAIARCDVLLRTTLYDGDAISVREALHLGTPVIATNNGMRPAGVRLMARHDVDALVDAVNDALEGRARTTQLIPSDGEENVAAVARLYGALLDDSRVAGIRA